MKSIPSHPVLPCAEAKTWEAGLLKDEAAEWAAMQEAGTKVALSILDDFKEIGGLPPHARLLVLAGKGHNGGDALLAAKSILEKHPQATVDVRLCFGEPLLRPLAKRSFDELRNAAGVRVREATLAGLKAELVSYDLCLDGVFGFQFRPPMEDSTAEILAWTNTHPRIRLRAAVDLPSGLGEQNAGTVFRADFTYATGIVKSPVVSAGNAACVGRLRYLDLGFFGNVAGLGEPGRSSLAKAAGDRPGSTPSTGSGRATPATERVLLPSILAPLTDLRPSQSDKRTFGHLFVIGGSLSYPGAVVLAVRAALRSGAGLVTAFVPESLVPEYAARHPEAMWVGCPVNGAGGLATGTMALVTERVARATALLIGPGLGSDPETLRTITDIVRNTNIPLVLDADALRPEVIAAAGDEPFIATPHAGEYQRIAATLAGAAQGMIVRKGPLTQVFGSAVLQPALADPGRGLKHRATTYYSPFGGPVLARGGSGDILAGLIGGLLAQKPDEPALAACRGVVWHGRAADLLARAHGQVSVETSQLLEQLGPALTPTPWQTH